MSVNLSLIECFSVQEIRDLPANLQTRLEVILRPSNARYLFDPKATGTDDGDTILLPTVISCTCCGGSGRWLKEDLGSGGGGGPDDDSAFLPLSGSSPMTGDLDMGTHQIHDVVDPTSAQDAATKNYVDSSITAATYNPITDPIFWNMMG